jgi:hypothetical protein
MIGIHPTGGAVDLEITSTLIVSDILSVLSFKYDNRWGINPTDHMGNY